MIRFVRLLGALLGVIIALQLARIIAAGFFEPTVSSSVLLIAWVAAWGSRCDRSASSSISRREMSHRSAIRSAPSPCGTRS